LKFSMTEWRGLADVRQIVALPEIHASVLAGIEGVERIVEQGQRGSVRRLSRHVVILHAGPAEQSSGACKPVRNQW
jgi:hypothetical protein